MEQWQGERIPLHGAWHQPQPVPLQQTADNQKSHANVECFKLLLASAGMAPAQARSLAPRALIWHRC